MKFKVATAPEKEPAFPDKAKIHPRSAPEGNVMFLPLMTFAREFCKSGTGRFCGILTLMAYPTRQAECIRLPDPPLGRVEKIKEKKTDGEGEELSTDCHEVYRVGGVLARRHWGKPAKATLFRVLYQTGYQKNLPKSIRQTTLLFIGHRYQDRGPIWLGRLPP